MIYKMVQVALTRIRSALLGDARSSGVQQSHRSHCLTLTRAQVQTLALHMGTYDASQGKPVFSQSEEVAATPSTKMEELRSFLFLTIVMAPALTFLLIAGYGFLVWMYQLVSGPPTGG